jgi:hypothetical protein
MNSPRTIAGRELPEALIEEGQLEEVFIGGVSPAFQTHPGPVPAAVV